MSGSQSNPTQDAAIPAEYDGIDFGLEEVMPGAGLLRYLTRFQIVLFAKFLEVTVIALVALVICAMNVRLGPDAAFRYAGASLIVALACYLSFLNSGLYHIDLLIDPLRAIRPLIINWTVAFITLSGILALVQRPDLFSRFWFVEFYAGGLVALGFERWSVDRLVRAWVAQGNYTKAVAIVGANQLAKQLIDRIRAKTIGIRLIGVFDDRRADATGRVTLKKLGNIDDLLAYGRAHTIDLVVVTLPITAADRIQEVFRRLREQPLDVRILPGEIGLRLMSPMRLRREELPGVQLISVMDHPISGFALFVKSAFDRAASAALLIALSPLMLICAAGISISDPGPVFFRQQRIGYKGRDFQIYKFRTMRLDHGGVTGLTRRDDPRIFPFGNWLRRTSLDELPQLVNVLIGDMSLVGPRPHLQTARAAGTLYYDAVNEYAARHRVKPGITGWAQVHGWRGPTETIEQIEKRVEHDIYYIENWSLLLDMIILVKTAFSGFVGSNAF